MSTEAYSGNTLWACVTDPLFVDFRLYDYWLAGLTVVQAARRYVEEYGAGEFDIETVEYEVHDQFSVFHLIEPHLANPPTFEKHQLFQMDSKLVKEIIERYYGFSDVFVRELVGKRPNNKTRDTLEDIAERIGISIIACRRQFENLRRIYKRIVSMTQSHQPTLPLVDWIMSNFRLSAKLAAKYVRLIFLVYHRFEMKKRLQFATFADMEKLAQQLLSLWTVHAQPEPHITESKVYSIHLHPKLVSRLRSLKTLVYSSRDNLTQYTDSVKEKLEKHFTSEHKQEFLEKGLSNMIKFLFTLGGNLAQAKEFKDMWADLAESLGEPCRRIDITSAELTKIFDALISSMKSIVENMADKDSRHRENLFLAWSCFLNGTKEALLIVYDRL